MASVRLMSSNASLYGVQVGTTVYLMWIAAGFLGLFGWPNIDCSVLHIYVSLIIHFWHCNSNHCLARTSRSVLHALIQRAQAVWKITLIAVIYSICLFILFSKRIQATVWHILSFHLFLVCIQVQTRWKSCTVSYFHLWQWAYAVLFSFSLCFQERNLPRGSVLKESTLQVIPMEIVEKTPKAPLLNVKQGTFRA